MLHTFVLAHRDELIARCKATAARRIAPLPYPDDRDFGIERFVDQLIKTLALERAGHRSEALEFSGTKDGISTTSATSATSDLQAVAARHGFELARHQFTIEQVVHDYGDLCQSITDLAVETGKQISNDEFRSLNRCLDNGIANAVKVFTLRREYQLLNAHERERAAGEVLNASLAERVAERTQELETACEELKAFSYSLAHDLRGPLSSINGFGLLLERLLPEDTPALALSHLGRIRAETVRMGDMVDAMLTLANLSRRELQWDVLDLSAAATSVLAELQERQPSRSVQISVQQGLHLACDAPLLRLVLENLLGNAWKFTAQHEHAHIGFGLQQLPSGESAFYVKDNGVGFDMDHAGKLFGLFERMNVAPEYAGSGIGLANVQRIIVRHKGRVWAQSVPGQGSTFYFTVGAAPAVAA
jgi:signal transduction histidine kinase